MSPKSALLCCGAALALLTGCQTATNSQNGGLEPPGFSQSGESVDGLIVGHNFMRAGEYELALKAYRRSIAEQGFTPDVMNGMGVAHLRLGQVNEAERLLRAAVQADPNFGPAWNNLGVLLAQKQEYLEAKRAFEIAFGLGEGRSQQIKRNIAKISTALEKNVYTEVNNQSDFELVRRGNGVYLLIETPSEEQTSR